MSQESEIKENKLLIAKKALELNGVAEEELSDGDKEILELHRAYQAEFKKKRAITPTKEKEPKENPPALDDTPIKFFKKDGKLSYVQKKEFKSKDLCEFWRKLVGVKDTEIGFHVLEAGGSAVESVSPSSNYNGLNVMLQAFNDQKPKNAFEAQLVAQATALFTHGMENLRRMGKSDMTCHRDHYLNAATKLLRLHSETIQALDKYRRGGEQRVVVQHVNVNDGGQAAIMTGNFKAEGGGGK